MGNGVLQSPNNAFGKCAMAVMPLENVLLRSLVGVRSAKSQDARDGLCPWLTSQVTIRYILVFIGCKLQFLGPFIGSFSLEGIPMVPHTFV